MADIKEAGDLAPKDVNDPQHKKGAETAPYEPDEQRHREKRVRSLTFGIIEIVAGGGLCGYAGDVSVAIGFHSAKAWFSFAGIAVVLFGMAHCLVGIYPDKKKLIKRTYVGIVAVLFFVMLAFANRLQPEQKPDFKFLFSTADTSMIALTNEFLISTNAGKSGYFDALGMLYVPLKTEQSNVVIRLGLKNDSSVLAEFPFVAIMLPKEWNCLPAPGWLRCRPDPLFTESDSMQCWAFRMPPILSGNSEGVPDFQIQIPKIPTDGLVSFLARADRSAALCLQFRMQFWPNGPGFKNLARPVVVLGKKRADGAAEFTIPDSAFEK